MSAVKRAHIGPIFIPRKMLIDQFIIGSTLLSGNILVGIYNDNNETPQGGSLVFHSAALPVAQVNVFPVNIVLSQGLYWVAVMFDSGASNFLRCFSLNALPNPYNGCSYTNASFTLADPCPAVTANSVLSPYVFLRVANVVE